MGGQIWGLHATEDMCTTDKCTCFFFSHKEAAFCLRRLKKKKFKISLNGRVAQPADRCEACLTGYSAY